MELTHLRFGSIPRQDCEDIIKLVYAIEGLNSKKISAHNRKLWKNSIDQDPPSYIAYAIQGALSPKDPEFQRMENHHKEVYGKYLSEYFYREEFRSRITFTILDLHPYLPYVMEVPNNLVFQEIKKRCLHPDKLKFIDMVEFHNALHSSK